jgi:hypothetical protein
VIRAERLPKLGQLESTANDFLQQPEANHPA